MTTDERATGGTDWELAEAERLMLNAQTAEERALAMRRHTEAIRNMMQNTLVPSFQKALGSILDTKLADLSQHVSAEFEAHGNIRRRQFEELRDHADARHDAILQLIDTLAHRIVTHEQRLDRKRERLDDHERRLARLEQHLGFDGDGVQ